MSAYVPSGVSLLWIAEVVRKAKTLEQIRQDFVVFSELSTTRYFCGYNDPGPFALARPLDGPLVQRFAERPYFFVRAATPQVLLDEVERVL